MDFPPPCTVPPGTDPRLHPFLKAAAADRADLELARLLELATPLIVRVVRSRSRYGTDPDAEDTASEARTQVVSCLQRLRRAGGGPEGSPPIADFETYVRTVAYNTWAGMLRQRNPGRAKLLNRLHYLLEKRSTQHGFALWTGAGNESWAGFEGWRGTAPNASSDDRLLGLLTDPRAVAAGIFGVGGWSALNLPDLVSGLLSWLGGPLKLQDLTDAVAALQMLPASFVVVPNDAADHDPAEPGPVDPHPSPCDELRWKEYLAWLWQQTAQLALPQKSAFLLHSPCLHEMEFAGLISVRQAAAALGLAAERMAELWNSLPLDDLGIGALLGVGRQQVINWRKAARIQLGREWQRWSKQE